MSGPWAGRRLHLIGAGGTGMSGYARAAVALGATVTGSDAAASEYARLLREDGVLDVRIGHDAANIPAGADVEVVHSTAIGAHNVERRAAAERGLRELTRAELLGELTALRRTIAVGGTHGKTTTSAMLVTILTAAGLDPGWLIGASAGAGLPNARWSEGEWLIVEADESDRSLLAIDAQIAVLLNVELDHGDVFSSLGELRELFADFLRGAPQAVLCAGGGLEELRADAALASPGHVELVEGGSRFEWCSEPVALRVPGVHNARNAAAALEAARLAGAAARPAAASLAAFAGAGRRFELVGEHAGARLYSDYAHHPSEVVATLAGARTVPHERLIAVFQPHMFSRTSLFAGAFGAALAAADLAVVLDVYPARERAAEHPGVSGLLVARAAADAGDGRTVRWAPALEDAQAALRELLRPGDICVVMGAGDVDELARRVVER
ncbi:MAG TPA: UDP-N-acetylmuramate--L-alanine ligase [Solirubrobacteraceae bacterium]|nr:UDP-N-acetylmuramate--L-alanine ligase [Solirubrobacteraceae bacterium]